MNVCLKRAFFAAAYRCQISVRSNEVSLDQLASLRVLIKTIMVSMQGLYLEMWPRREKGKFAVVWHTWKA